MILLTITAVIFMNMFSILMMSAKLANPGLLQTIAFWKWSYDVIISVQDITNKTLWCDPNYIVDLGMWSNMATGKDYAANKMRQREVTL